MLITILILLPLFFAVAIAVMPNVAARAIALLSSLVVFAVSLGLLAYDPNSGEVYQFVQNVPWLKEFGISYHVGVDGTSVWLILASTFLQIFGVCASWNTIKTREKEFFVFLTLLQAALVGAFSALDLILFYIFFEGTLIPTYFLIGIWGGKKREYAATKFFLFALVGSLLMLGGILALHFHVSEIAGVGRTFDLLTIRAALESNPLPTGLGLLLFAAFAVAFAIKVPLFPLHSWMVDFYTEAPIAALMVLMKLGGYGFYRFCLPLFPEAAKLCAPLIIGLSVIGILYGALIALVQRDLRRVAVYSSISHLSLVTLGLFSFTTPGTTGAVFQMVSYSITTGAFLLLINMLEARRGTSNLRDFGGLWGQMPLFGRIFLIVTLSSIALPLTNGFVGEFLVLLGAFQVAPWAAGIATLGVILSAAYMLWMFQQAMYGPVARAENRRLSDLNLGELATIVPFVLLIFALGIVPTLVTKAMSSGVTETLHWVGPPIPTVEETAGVVKPGAVVRR